MPFRFGVITMRAAPVLTIAVEIEDGRGRRATGYAADLLAFRRFDKRPEKSLAENCADLIRVVEAARDLCLEAGREGLSTPFRLLLDTHAEVERRALASGFNRLGASFGSSMLERAVIDALGRLSGKTCFELVRDDDLGIDLGAISLEVAGQSAAELLPPRPLDRLHVLPYRGPGRPDQRGRCGRAGERRACRRRSSSISSGTDRRRDARVPLLQVPGMGFSALPALADVIPTDQWDFASLGQNA